MISILPLSSTGFSSADHRAPVEIPARVRLMFAILMAPKKVIQWVAMRMPHKAMKPISFQEARKGRFFQNMNNAMATVVMAVRLKTRETASTLMYRPRMAVKPQINTMKCRLSWSRRCDPFSKFMSNYFGATM